MSDNLYEHLFKIIVLTQDFKLSKHIYWLIQGVEPKKLRTSKGIDIQFITLHREDFDVKLYLY
ncbi:MAG: hypothetical protein ACP6IY_02115 [Promethearchaeia archaeon]